MSKMIKKMLLTGLFLTVVVAPVQELSATKTTVNDLYPKIGKDLRDVRDLAYLIAPIGLLGGTLIVDYGLHNNDVHLAKLGVVGSIIGLVFGFYAMFTPDYQRATVKDVMEWGKKRSDKYTKIAGKSKLVDRLCDNQYDYCGHKGLFEEARACLIKQ